MPVLSSKFFEGTCTTFASEQYQKFEKKKTILFDVQNVKISIRSI